jgi:hypothetical protein
VGLSTDPAAAITFDEDAEEGKVGKKKISLVDYFYVKVFSWRRNLTIVQSSSSTTWIALYYCSKEYFLAYGGTILFHLTPVRFAMSLQVKGSCANSMNVRQPHSSRLLALYTLLIFSNQASRCTSRFH